MPHSRAQNVNNSHASNPSKSHNTRAQAQSATNQGSVRRNLFHQNLNQRSGTTKPSPEIVSEPERPTSATVFGLTTAEVSASLTASSPLDSREIVPRDQNGNYKLDIPALPPVMLEDEGDESPMDGMEDGQPGTAGSGNTGMTNSGMDGELGSRDKEKLEASLVEMMYRNRNRQLSNDPSEILNLIHQSLRMKVAALDEDNWMFEPEDDIRI